MNKICSYYAAKTVFIHVLFQPKIILGSVFCPVFRFDVFVLDECSGELQLALLAALAVLGRATRRDHRSVSQQVSVWLAVSQHPSQSQTLH